MPVLHRLVPVLVRSGEGTASGSGNLAQQFAGFHKSWARSVAPGPLLLTLYQSEHEKPSADAHLHIAL